MKNLILSLFILSSIHASAQTLEDHYIATVTHDTVLSTQWNNIENSDQIMLSFKMTRHNSQYSIGLKYHFGKSKPFKVAKGDSVMIKFAAGWTMVIYSPDTVTSRPGGATYPGTLNGAITHGVFVTYPLSFGEMAALSTNDIEKIRIFTSRGYDTYEFPKSKRDRIANYSKMVMQHFTDWNYIRGEKSEPVKEAPKKKNDEW